MRQGVLSFEEFLDYYNKFVARHRSQCAELYNMSEHVLGSGAFGVVLRGTRIDNGQGVAVKRLVKEKIQDSVELLHNEIAVWEALDHPHLVGQTCARAQRTAPCAWSCKRALWSGLP